MSKFYFTFGSHSQYPYQNGYIIIEADSLTQATEYFKILFPNPDKPYLLRCAFYYNEKQWEKATENHLMKYYGTYRMVFTESDDVVCCLCGERINRKDSHDASPIMKARCCPMCNAKHVIPARITLSKEGTKIWNS